MPTEEEWRWVKGCEGKYKVSNKGNVYSCFLKRNMSLQIGKPGYVLVSIMVDGKCKKIGVHRLVASAFLDNEYNKPEVNHKDGNKQNNSVENLEWVTRSENELHAFRVLGKKPNAPWRDKPRKFARRFTDEQVREIRTCKSPSTALAREYGVSKQTILNIRKFKIYKEVANVY